MAEPETWSLEGALDEIEAINDRQPDRSFAFLLGAGASAASGIPSGGRLAEAWVRELYERSSHGDLDLGAWIEAGKCGIDGLKPDRLAEHYPQIFERRFRADRESGYAYLEAVMEGREPSLGYSLLAEILKDTRHKVVITTNFDNLVADALAIHAQAAPLVVGHETLTGFVRPTPRRPLVAKIHRDIFYAPKNDVDGVNTLGAGWPEALRKLFQAYTPVVIGYGGNDGSLMGFLNALPPETIAGRMIWCTHAGSAVNPRVCEVVSRHDGVFVPISGFDEFMLCLTPRLLPRFDLSRTAARLERLGMRRADRYRNQIEKVRRRTDTSTVSSDATHATRQALRRALNIVSKDESNWWTWELRARSEEDLQTKIDIYGKALERLPKDADLTRGLAVAVAFQGGTSQAHALFTQARELNPKDVKTCLDFADFLARRRSDDDLEKARGLYLHALAIDPDYVETIERYAYFLGYVTRQVEEANAVFARAMEADPNDPVVTRNYAKFLISEKRDVARAGEMYRKAVLLNPSHAETIGNYAHFLDRERGIVDEAYEHYRKAIDLDPTVAFIQANYGIFLLTRMNDPDAAQLSFAKALELMPLESSYVGNYLSLLINYRRDFVEAEQHARAACTKERSCNNLANLAAVLLCKLELGEARATARQAIAAAVGQAPQQPLAEALLYEALISLSLGEAETPSLGRLKGFLDKSFTRFYWEFRAVLDLTLHAAAPANRELFHCVAQAILDRKAIGALAKLPAWCASEEMDPTAAFVEAA